MRETEPREVRRPLAPHGTAVPLGVGDQKGLLAACHTRDVANSYGDRFGDGEGSEDKQDLAPDRLWYLLKLYLHERGVPLILDLEAGPEVWNFPVYAYEIDYQPAGADGQYQATLALLLADDGVPPDYVGTKPRRHTYQFSFCMRDGAVEADSGRWLGTSRDDHPDFAWYPLVTVAENPEVKHPAVQRLMGAAPATSTGRAGCRSVGNAAGRTAACRSTGAAA